jgi:hypothetical protein
MNGFQSLRIENWELRNGPLVGSESNRPEARAAINQFQILNSQFSIPQPP